MGLCAKLQRYHSANWHACLMLDYVHYIAFAAKRKALRSGVITNDPAEWFQSFWITILILVFILIIIKVYINIYCLSLCARGPDNQQGLLEQHWKALHTKHRWPPRERLSLSATLRFNSTLQWGRCLGYLHLHNHRRAQDFTSEGFTWCGRRAGEYGGQNPPVGSRGKAR